MYSGKKMFFSFLLALCLSVSVFSVATATDAWNCPECGRIGNTGNYCGGCGHASPYLEGQSDESVYAQGEDKTVDFRTVGNTVTFGRYEQDNNTANGPEAIEWIVLDYDEKENKALLLSKYGLDAKPYNTDNADITWQECTLRTWLNGKFSRVAFTSKERTAILETKVNNGINQGYSKWNTRGGYHTSDRLFLLSYHEAFELFFSSDSERMCTPTDYAIAQDTVVSGWWWLRSPGYSQDVAADVYTDGSLSSRFINSGSGCVRPAFWIDLEADVF